MIQHALTALLVHKLWTTTRECSLSWIEFSEESSWNEKKIWKRVPPHTKTNVAITFDCLHQVFQLSNRGSFPTSQLQAAQQNYFCSRNIVPPNIYNGTMIQKHRHWPLLKTIVSIENLTKSSCSFLSVSDVLWLEKRIAFGDWQSYASEKLIFDGSWRRGKKFSLQNITITFYCSVLFGLFVPLMYCHSSFWSCN